MSTFVSRSRVRKVENVVSRNLQLAAQIIGEMRPAFGTASSEVFRAVHEEGATAPLTIGSAPAFEQFASAGRTTSADQLKWATLDQISSAPCLVEDSAAFKASLERLSAATTPAEVLKERATILDDLRSGHERAFLRSLTQACASAAGEAGFGRIEQTIDPLGAVRIIASNASGQSLVAELCTDRNGEVKLESEIVGVKDGSCEGMMQQFEKVLEREGVRSALSRRERTGGVARLAAAKAFINKQVGCTRRRVQRLAKATMGRTTR